MSDTTINKDGSGVNPRQNSNKQLVRTIFGEDIQKYGQYRSELELFKIAQSGIPVRELIDASKNIASGVKEYLTYYNVLSAAKTLLNNRAEAQEKKQAAMKLFLLVPEVLTDTNAQEGLGKLNGILQKAMWTGEALSPDDLAAFRDELNQALTPGNSATKTPTPQAKPGVTKQKKEKAREKVADEISKTEEQKQKKTPKTVKETEVKPEKKSKKANFLTRPVKWGPFKVFSPLVPNSLKENLRQGGWVKQKLRGGPFGIFVPASKIKNDEGYGIKEQAKRITKATVASVITAGGILGGSWLFPDVAAPIYDDMKGKYDSARETVIEVRDDIVSGLGGYTKADLQTEIKKSEKGLIQFQNETQKLINQKIKEKREYAKGIRKEPVQYSFREVINIVAFSKLRKVPFNFDGGMISNGGKPINLNDLRGSVGFINSKNLKGLVKHSYLDDNSFENVTFLDKVILSPKSKELWFNGAKFKKGIQLGSLKEPVENINLQGVSFNKAINEGDFVLVARDGNINGLNLDGFVNRGNFTFVVPKGKSKRQNFSSDKAIIQGRETYTRKGIVEKSKDNYLNENDFDNSKYVNDAIKVFQDKVKANQKINQSDVDKLFAAKKLEPDAFKVDFSGAVFAKNGISFANKDLSNFKFNNSVFLGNANFDGAKVNKDTDFIDTKFFGTVSAKNTNISESNIKDAYFKDFVPGLAAGSLTYKKTAEAAKLKIKQGKAINQGDVDALAYLAKLTKGKLDLEGVIISGDLKLGGRYCVGANFKGIKVEGNVDVTGANLANSDWTGAKIGGDFATNLGTKWDWDPSKVQKNLDIKKLKTLATVQAQLNSKGTLGNMLTVANLNNINLSSIDCKGSIKLVGLNLQFGAATTKSIPSLDGAKIGKDLIIMDTLYNDSLRQDVDKPKPWQLSINNTGVGGNAIIVGNFVNLSIDKSTLGKTNKNSKLFLGGTLYNTVIGNSDVPNIYVSKDSTIANSKIDIKEANKATFWKNKFENTDLTIRNSDKVQFVGGTMYGIDYGKGANQVNAGVELEGNRSVQINRDNDTGNIIKIYKGVKADKDTRSTLRRHKNRRDKIFINRTFKK